MPKKKVDELSRMTVFLQNGCFELGLSSLIAINMAAKDTSSSFDSTSRRMMSESGANGKFNYFGDKLQIILAVFAVVWLLSAPILLFGTSVQLKRLLSANQITEK